MSPELHRPKEGPIRSRHRSDKLECRLFPSCPSNQTSDMRPFHRLRVLAYTRILVVCERFGMATAHVRLSPYHNHSFAFIRNDPFDRIRTRLEKRLTNAEIAVMMATGLQNIQLTDSRPFWLALGYKGIPTTQQASHRQVFLNLYVRIRGNA